jgi:arylsulfatase A
VKVFPTLSICLLAALVSAASAAKPAIAQPNIVFILADDLGYECIGANGGTSYKTPVLDALAKSGVRFERCYAQPLCTPTRVQLMTGQYNVRNYTRFGSMDPNLKTFGNLFKEAGYATCIAGKWQLGRVPDLPKKFGFDEACLWQHLRRPGRYKNPGLEINGELKDYTRGEYGPDIVNDYAIDFINRHKETPFFLYYPMMLTHDPYDATPDSADYDAARRGSRRATNADGINIHFSDMVQYMDKLVGKVVATLDASGLRERTLLIFLGDNGTRKGTRSRMGDRLVIGGKGTLTEAGMRVPLIVNWPGHAASGKVSADLVDTTDFLPTLCDVAGVKVPATWPHLDGISFFSQLRGETPTRRREWIYSWYKPRAVFVGEFAATARYKLYRTGAFHDLVEDPEEMHPLKSEDLKGEAEGAAQLLRGALDQYKDARPATLRELDKERRIEEAEPD